jgi:hypothetical protein
MPWISATKLRQLEEDLAAYERSEAFVLKLHQFSQQVVDAERRINGRLSKTVYQQRLLIRKLKDMLLAHGVPQVAFARIGDKNALTGTEIARSSNDALGKPVFDARKRASRDLGARAADNSEMPYPEAP